MERMKIGIENKIIFIKPLRVTLGDTYYFFMRLSLPLATVFSILFLGLTVSGLPNTTGSLDLHTHLFFHEGVGVSLLGSFEGPIQAKSWKDKWPSKVNQETLEASQAQVVVVALYTHPLFVGPQRDAIRRQIYQAHRFVRDNPQWVIATNPQMALKAYKEGYKVMIFSLEGASFVLESEDDIKEFIDGFGISIVTIMHFTDDHFGGAALLPDTKGFLSPIGYLKSFLKPLPEDQVRLSDRGLTEKGRWLVSRLIEKKVWIDLAHSSDATQSDLINILEAKHIPLLHTHTLLRQNYPAERGISSVNLERLRKSGGFIGLIPSEDMLSYVKVDPKYCKCQEKCEGGVPALATQYELATRILGVKSVAISTDMNAPMQFMRPLCENKDPHAKGFWNYAQLPEIWNAMQSLGAPVPENIHVITENFLKTWEKAFEQSSL